MPWKSNAAQSHIENLGSRAQKWPSVTIEDVEDEDDFNHKLASIDQKQSDLEHLGETFIINEDGSLTLVGFLKDLEDEPLSDFTSESDYPLDDELETEDQEEDDTEIQKYLIWSDFHGYC